MTIDVAMNTLLRSVAGITSLAGQRIYSVNMPQNPSYPAITVHQIGEEEYERVLNQSPGGARLLSGRWQIDCWGLTQKTTRALGLAVFAGIDSYDAPSATAGNVVRIEAIGGGECDYDETVQKWFLSRDYRVWWRE